MLSAAGVTPPAGSVSLSAFGSWRPGNQTPRDGRSWSFMTVNEDKLMGYVHQAVGDFGSLLSAALINIGDKLGLFKAMVSAGPLTAAELAKKTGTTERYVREWASGLAAAGYLDYGDGRYELNEEQAIVFADEASPAYVMGGFQGMLAATRIVPKAVEAFRTGDGIGWHEHDPDLFQGTERFFRPGYGANLVQSWIPSLNDAEAKLRAGGKAADVGCGYGASTIIMAVAYPNSHFLGPVCLIESTSKSPLLRSTRAPTLTWFVTSTARTTWATRLAQPATPASRSRLTGIGCWSSHSPTMTSPTTSTPSAGSSIRRLP